MQLSKLRVDQRIQGPSGAVYQVIEIRPRSAIAVPIEYTQQAYSGLVSMELDQVALDRFVPYVGDSP